MPTWDEHVEFCRSTQYRAWYLVFDGASLIGSAYVTNVNSIGLNLEDGYCVDYVISSVLNSIAEFIKPLPPVASHTPKDFYINAPIANKKLISSLRMVGGQLTSVAFRIDPTKLKT
jgi:hypothetical protein